jgi:hypothetical protein
MSTRCLSNTNQGKQCTRNAVPGSLFCYQHQQKVMAKSEKESEDKIRELLIRPEEWEGVDLDDIPLSEFKSKFRGRTLPKKSTSPKKKPRKSTSPKKKPRKSTSPKKKSRSRSPKECCVCLEKSEDTLKCKHTICVDCTKQLYNPICPLCRRDLEGPTITKEVLDSIKENMSRLIFDVHWL